MKTARTPHPLDPVSPDVRTHAYLRAYYAANRADDAWYADQSDPYKGARFDKATRRMADRLAAMRRRGESVWNY